MEQPERDESATTEKDWRGGVQWVASWLYGTLFAGVAAGLIMELWPRSTQMTAFLCLFILLAPLFSVIGRWVFIIHPDQIAKKVEDEDASRGHVDDD